MKLHFLDEYIPGTKLKKAEMENLTGMAFLKKVFFVSEGVMLTQIRDISGIDILESLRVVRSGVRKFGNGAERVVFKALICGTFRRGTPLLDTTSAATGHHRERKNYYKESMFHKKGASDDYKDTNFWYICRK